MTTPKEARKLKQMEAQGRKRLRAEKQRSKRAKRMDLADAFLELLTGWLERNPREAFTDECPGCGADIFVTYENGRIQHGHVDPSCAGYATFEQMMGNESPPLDHVDSSNP